MRFQKTVYYCVAQSKLSQTGYQGFHGLSEECLLLCGTVKTESDWLSRFPWAFGGMLVIVRHSQNRVRLVIKVSYGWTYKIVEIGKAL